MNQKVLDFITSHRVCSLTTILPDGSPHSSAMHYSHSIDPLIFYFSSDNESKKFQGLVNNNTVKASMVIGFSEEEWLTLQMDGKIQVITDTEVLTKVKKQHYTKNPSAEIYKDEPYTVFLSFTPTWWRFTDFNTKPETILSSD